MKSLIFLYDSKDILDSARKFEKYDKILVLDKKIHFGKDLEYKDDFKIIYVENIFDKACVISAFKDIYESLNVEAVFANFEGVVEIAGALRDYFNIRGLKEEQSLQVRDKYLMKSIIKANAIKCANYEIVQDIENTARFASNNGFPIILKPRCGFGAKSTYLVKDEDELKQLFLNRNLEGYISESFVKGQEYHCDSIIKNNNIIFSSVGKYHNNPLNTVVSKCMDGTIVFPYNFDSEIIKNIKKFNEDVIKSFEIEQGITHLEVFVNEKGEIFFGEIGLRLPGGYICKDIYNSYGIDLYKVFIDIEIGDVQIDVNAFKPKFTGHGIFPTVKGEIIKISQVDEFQHYKNLIHIDIFNEIGDTINERNSIMDRTGYFIVQGISFKEVYEVIKNIYESFKVVTK